MKSYSTDLRERVVAACAAGDRSIPQVGARFSVSVSFVNKLRQRTSGSVAALPHRGGPAPALEAGARAQSTARVAQQPDATLDELRAHLAACGGPAVGRTTVWQAWQALDLRRKKRASTPLNVTPHA